MRTLVWFRGKDLRVADHAPLMQAIEAGEVVPLFVLDPYFFAPPRARAIPHRIQFLLESLRALEAKIAELGSRLIVLEGKSTELVPQLARKWKVDRVLAHRWVEPFARERDRRVAEALHVPFELFEGETLHPPGTLRTGSGDPYSVFTPFSRAFRREATIGAALKAPTRMPPLPADIRDKSQAIPSCEQLGITPNPALIQGGESRARQRLAAFLAGPADRYTDGRNRLDLPGTSRMSADLKFGLLSVRSVWRAVTKALAEHSQDALSTYQNELIWREFTYSTLWDRPELLEQPFRPAWKRFPWLSDKRGWQAWTAGTTGYPVVDASARQLLGEGFVHNRARMISASFLCKHLLIDYKRGEAHYLHWLVDADWASNNAGWQWSAGCGSDAQPYFRVFNPVTQGEKFDPAGDYVRRWVPELAKLPTKYIHAPWDAPPSELSRAGIALGKSYPRPIVEHSFARERFLDVAKQHLASQQP